MNTSLELDISAAFERMAAQTTIDPHAQFARRAIVVEAQTPRRRIFTPVFAAAAALAVVGAVVTVSYLRSDPPADPLGWASTDVASPAIGLFPAGDAAAITAAGYTTPRAAVDAYLADRTRPEALPSGVEATYSVGMAAVPTKDRRAIVGFSLATSDDSGDGLLVVEQIAPLGSPERWVVLGGASALITIDELEYRNGRLTGSFTNDLDGGTTAITVVDAITGQRLATTTGGSFTVDGLTAGAVAVRVWNTGSDGVAPQAGFAEALVAEGGTVRGVSFASLGRPYSAALMAQDYAARSLPPFDTGPVSAFDNLEVGQVVSILAEGGTTIAIRRGDEVAPFCVEIFFGERSNGLMCFTLDGVAKQREAPSTRDSAFFDAQSMDGTQVLVGGVVPDAVTEVRSDTGKVIIPVHNVWWDVMEDNRPITYTITTADGRTVEAPFG